MIDTFVKSFTHLKDRPKQDQALLLLQRIASLVKPVMRKRGWVLPVLSEFFPESPNLLGLNVNAGQKILIRLRPPFAPDTFYDEDDLVHTMLHELTHNVHGPHDQQFYKYLAGLEEEFESLKRGGYDGEGFFSKGHRVGQNVAHDLPPHLAKAKALEAAEKRRKVSQVLGGPKRLGGGIRNGNKSPRELAAEAAERRIRDERACGSGEEAIRETEKAAREGIVNDVIDLTGDSEDEIEPSKTSTPASSSSPALLFKFRLQPQPLVDLQSSRQRVQVAVHILDLHDLHLLRKSLTLLHLLQLWILATLGTLIRRYPKRKLGLVQDVLS
ncbi:hypothetical protein QCA50_010299 [Cerrena zonata]|uniref:WLM domain-containing protein n=1 Tax=Cerrena zonata TaxID=2478898 RepID=A0AAW0G4T5_9APHY